MKRYSLLLIFALQLLILAPKGHGQCTLLPNAIPGITLTYQSTNLLNCSGVAYNPLRGLYYAVRAGNPGFPLETWSSIGTQLFSTSAGFDYRGMWWNPNTSQMEANGYSNRGIWRANLNANGYALNTGTTLLAANQPNTQACGDYDDGANEIIYYNGSGRIYRYSRTNNAFLGSYTLNSIPVGTGNLNNTTVFYTGCSGQEIGVLDYVNRRVYIFNKSNGNFVGASQLPLSAVTTNRFRCSWANGMLWLFDLSSRRWTSYQIFNSVLDASALVFRATPMTFGVVELSWTTGEEAEGVRYELERSLDGSDFYGIAEMEGSKKAEPVYVYMDRKATGSEDFYYRVKVIDRNGDASYSDVRKVSFEGMDEAEMLVYPNPATSHVYVRFNLVEETSGTVRVVNELGAVVLEKALTSNELGMGEIELNTSNLASGVYIVQLDSQHGDHLRKRVVVSH